MSFESETTFDRELERRLAVLESPDYSDPARDDLPNRDLVALCIGIVFLNLVSFAFLY